METHENSYVSGPLVVSRRTGTGRTAALSPARNGTAPVRRLSATSAFYLQASIIVSFLAASSAPTPLYASYQAAWGFSPITTTVVFGVYAFAVLGTLLTLGSLSDHVGRRPVLFLAILLQATVMLIFANASGVAALILARVTQGVSTGAAVGAVGAGLLDLDRAKGTLANAVGPVTGTAVGGITSGLMVQYLPAPTQLIYFVLLGVFLVQALGVAFMPETSALKPGALASLRPHLRVPSALRQPVLIVAPALVAAWALAGFYGSLAPTLIRRLVGTTSTLFGGVALFVLASSAGIAVLVLRERTQRTLMTFGSSALLLGVAITLLAIDAASLALFLLGTSVAGMGFGAAFQGALRGVIPLAAPDERAGVLSVLYIISYLAMGLPAVLGGILVVYAGGLVSTTREYGASIMLLAAMALAGTFSTARKIATAPLLGRATRAPRAQRGHA